jgi:hypothetical protein
MPNLCEESTRWRCSRRHETSCPLAIKDLHGEDQCHVEEPDDAKGQREHNTIADYAREVRGRTHFEVPVSGPNVTPRSRTGRIDAVRIQGLGADRQTTSPGPSSQT